MADAKNALVAGGTGGIGEGIVRLLLDRGWTVFVPLRGTEGGDRLQAYVAGAGAERLHLVPADLGVPAQVAGLRARVVEKAGTLDLVVVSVGSSYYGPSLHLLEANDWEKLLAENLATHFYLQHEFLGALHAQNRGTYVTLTGPEADFAHPETGVMSVVAAAQKMMARVEALEASGTGVKVYSVTSKTAVATRSRGGQAGADWVTPHELGEYAVALAEGRAPGASEAVHVLENRDQVRRLLKLKD